MATTAATGTVGATADGPRRTIELAIVGGGPAGRAAARMAAELGIEALLLDDQAGDDGPTMAWGIWGTTVAFTLGGATLAVEARTVILATGSIDRTRIFPGWDLDGVSSLSDSLDAEPSPAATVLAGSGPDLIAAAAQLTGRGHRLEAIVDAAQIPRLRARDRAWLRRNDMPYLTGSLVTAAIGRRAIEAVTVSRIDRQWRPMPGSAMTIGASRLIVDHGAQAASELSRLAGCAHVYDEDGGGYLPVRDEWLRTSVPGILAAGGCAGTASASGALLEGRLAAVTVARDLGRISEPAAERLAAPLQRRLARSRRVERLFRVAHASGPGLYEMSSPETTLCSCEGVAVAEVETALADAVADPNVIKVRTRAGAGICQARRCGRQLTWLVARRSRIPIAGVEPLSVRPPVRPIPIAALIEPD